MSELNSEEVEHLANLSRLSLSKNEKEDFSKTLPQILEFVDKLQSAKGLEKPDSKAISQDNLREDVEDSDSLSLGQLEKLAPYWQDNQVEVPPVFGESGNE